MTTALLVLFLVGIAWFVILGMSRGGAKTAEPDQPPSPATRPSTKPLAWPSKGEFACEVVGESNYQENIKRVLTVAEKRNDETPLMALLTPEPDNKHDRNAVNVKIGGVLVGYLSRDFAPVYLDRLRAEGMGIVPVYCQAQVTGGFRMNDGQLASYGIELDIDEFEEN